MKILYPLRNAFIRAGRGTIPDRVGVDLILFFEDIITGLPFGGTVDMSPYKAMS